MDSSTPNGVFKNIFENFAELTKKSEVFLQQDQNLFENFKNDSKSLYDQIVQANALTALKSKSLPKLLVNGFDEEQIWQQLQLQNKSASTHFENCISQFSFKNNDSLESVHIDQDPEDEALDSSHNESEEQESNDEDYELNNHLGVNADADNANLNSEMSELDDGESGLEPDTKSKKSRRKGVKSCKYKSEVDDQFFKLSKLEQFLRIEDLKEEKARDGELDASDDEDDEEIDLFQDIPSDDEDESEDEGDHSNQNSSKNVMYEDFFDAPESEDNHDSDEELSEFEQDKSDYFDINRVASDEEINEEDDLQTHLIDTKKLAKTPYEIQQEKINKQISEYEDAIVNPKPWQLTGEVDAISRPIDALLDLPTDFDMNAKPVIIQDKEFCEKIENLIKMTKKNKAYSDGVRKVKTTDEVVAAKKSIIIEQTKSKKSLAQEYEDMYLKKQMKQEEEEDPKHKEIIKYMDTLFPELYALFSHIPKPAIPDIKIVSNLPAITVEEVAPISYTDSALLAPEEIKKRTGVLKGQTERTDVDRKRERRKKKLHQKMKQKKKENTSDKPLSAKARKQEKLATLKKLKQHRNTKIATMDGEKIKSSKDFFERLQETVSSKVNKNPSKPVKKKRKT